MSINKNSIQKIASLSKLNLDKNDIKIFSEQLNTIVDYWDLLNEVDTTDVKPLYHVHDIDNITRDDILSESLPTDIVLENAPESYGDYFKVPNVIKGSIK